MTIACLDCEFNGYKGELISMALVVNDFTHFYEVLECPNPVPWVAENVMPILGKEPISLNRFRSKLEKFINQYDSLVIIADWPDDIKYFCDVIITGPGDAIATPEQLSFVLKRVDTVSKQPHNALADATAIMKFIADIE